MSVGDAPSPRWRVATLMWAALLVGLHAIPRADLIRLAGDEDLVNSTILDKLAHALMFGTLGVLAGRGWPGPTWPFLALATAFGGLLEAFQGVGVAGRSASGVDWVCDTIGAAAGWFAAGGHRRRRGDTARPAGPAAEDQSK